eukprot:CAMPEP_0184414000 /NCGR_PEP_ID=MMETSP0738-20130409/7672_1 /TAXON_ID=385413 /ORGANISM="Thalassiosira miniscula, Strain CCMP1093" /LENGTH=51 /DNA_ID=CAMNT_0026772901 /DNA_START=306 /DNA_END=461 /DNA_ORIENTATION=-
MADDTYHDSLARTLSAFDALSEEDEDALIGQQRCYKLYINEDGDLCPASVH